MRILILLLVISFFSCKNDKKENHTERNYLAEDSSHCFVNDSSFCGTVKCYHNYQIKNLLGKTADDFSSDSVSFYEFEFLNKKSVYFKNSQNQIVKFRKESFLTHGSFHTCKVPLKFFKNTEIRFFLDGKQVSCIDFKFKKYRLCTLSINSSTSSVDINYLIPPMAFQ